MSQSAFAFGIAFSHVADHDPMAMIVRMVSVVVDSEKQTRGRISALDLRAWEYLVFADAVFVAQHRRLPLISQRKWHALFRVSADKTDPFAVKLHKVPSSAVSTRTTERDGEREREKMM